MGAVNGELCVGFEKLGAINEAQNMGSNVWDWGTIYEWGAKNESQNMGSKVWGAMK